MSASTQLVASERLNGLEIGDTFEDMLMPAREGVKTQRRVNGRICFIRDQYDDSLAGDRWRLKLVGENPRGTVYFAEAVELLDAGDGFTELFRSLSISSYSFQSVREAHRLIVDSEQACTPDSVGLAGAMLEVARKTGLPDEYRRYLAQRVMTIYQKQLPANDPRMLAVLKVLAHTAADEEKESAFEAVVILQDQIGDSKESRASALGNLAEAIFKQERHSEALVFYRRAYELSENDYMASQLAVCLAKQGDFEAAYRLIADFPDWFFSCREGEWSESRYDVLFEEHVE
jgi:hypothetical protein